MGDASGTVEGQRGSAFMGMITFLGASRSALLACLIAMHPACSPYPRDIEGTLDKVRSARIIRVGLLDGRVAASDRARVVAYLARISVATGASPRIETGSTEPMLTRLEAGQLDLVVGEIATDSPWVTAVAVIEPLAERPVGGRRIGLSPIARNGENEWILLLEREVRDMQTDR